MDKNNTKEEKNMNYAEECNHINPDYYPQWATHMAHMSDMHIFSENDLDAMIPYIKLALKTGPIHLHICNLTINEETGEISCSCDEEEDDFPDDDDNDSTWENEDGVELTPEDYEFLDKMEAIIKFSFSNDHIAEVYKRIATYCDEHNYDPDVCRTMCEMVIKG